jgi:hypothetical protein
VIKKSDIAAAMWEVMVSGYNGKGRDNFALPASEAMDIILSLAANVITQLPTRQERQRAQREASQKLDRFISAVRQQAVHMPATPSLILPN